MTVTGHFHGVDRLRDCNFSGDRAIMCDCDCNFNGGRAIMCDCDCNFNGGNRAIMCDCDSNFNGGGVIRCLIDDRLYSAILRSLEQTHCARMWLSLIHI